MYDNSLVLQASQTVTASTTSTALNLPTGTPRRGLKARVVTSAISGTSPTVAYKVQHSTDNTTFYDLAEQLGGANVTAAGVDWISFESSNAYVRLVATVGGTSPSVTYHSEISEARP